MDKDSGGQSSDRNFGTATPASLEGRLLAQRQVLVLLARALTPEAKGELVDWLEDQSTFNDGQEDPGAVPGAVLGIGLATADEFRAIRDLLTRS
jgi:hypothetical protein